MNRKYFGDTRDLFKFDLVRHLVKSLPELGGFAFVPMLTENSTGKTKKSRIKTDLDRAVKAGKAGSQNQKLREQLVRLQEISVDREYLSGVSDYFSGEKILIDICGDELFTHAGRDSYLGSVFTSFPKNALIFFDPDTGLADAKADNRHLLMQEIRQIHNRMDKNSILMLYQHFPRVSHNGFVKKRCRDLEKLTGSCPLTITDNEVIFFLMAKNPKLAARLKDTLECYADTYPALYAYCADTGSSRLR